MNILNESGIKKIDNDLIKFYFDVKSSSLEHLEEHKSGMFSTQNKLQETRNQLLNFVNSYKNRNSLFFIFLDEVNEHNLKIIASSVPDEPDELTKRFYIVLDSFTLEMEVRQLSISSKTFIFE